MKYLAMDVGGTFVKYAVITDCCEILEKSKTATIVEPLEDFLALLTSIYDEFRGRVDGIALSIAGIIDSETGFMYTGGNISCIKNLNIVDVLEERCGVPVTVENDAKCAALAEVWQGALKDCRDGIVMVCGTGIGGALIHDRRVLKGFHNMAGEFSYVITDAEPKYSLNHTFAGNSGIKSLVTIVSKHTRIPEEELDGERIFSMANGGDKEVFAGLKEYVRHIAVQINNYQFIIDPEKIVIGGGISVQPLFLTMIREELQKINEVYPWDLPVAKVAVCRFFNDANLIGAAYVHLKSREKEKM